MGASASDAEGPEQQPLPSSTCLSAADEVEPARAFKSTSASPRAVAVSVTATTAVQPEAEAQAEARLTPLCDELAGNGAGGSVGPCAAERGGDEAAVWTDMDDHEKPFEWKFKNDDGTSDFQLMSSNNVGKLVMNVVMPAVERARVAMEAELEMRTAAAAASKEKHQREEREAVPATAVEASHATPPPADKQQQQCQAFEQSKSDGVGEMR